MGDLTVYENVELPVWRVCDHRAIPYCLHADLRDNRAHA